MSEVSRNLEVENVGLYKPYLLRFGEQTFSINRLLLPLVLIYSGMTAIYIRTSTAEQTPDLQLRDILPMVAGDYIVYKEQLSAYKENTKRPEFEKVLNAIKAGKIKDLYAWDLDRLYRNRLRLKELFTFCKVYGTTVHTYNQSWLEEINRIPPPFNEIVQELLINLFGWLGAEESQKKSDRVRLAIKKDSQGITRSYKGAKWGRKGFPIQTINRVLELQAAGGSIREIAGKVKVYDKNRNERSISKSAVHKILALNAHEKHRSVG